MEQLVTELDRELSRIEAEHRRRDSSQVLTQRYSLFNETVLLHSQSQQRNLLALLKRHNFTNLREKKILDVGCGNGDQLRHFLEYGTPPVVIQHRLRESRCE